MFYLTGFSTETFPQLANVEYSVTSREEKPMFVLDSTFLMFKVLPPPSFPWCPQMYDAQRWWVSYFMPIWIQIKFVCMTLGEKLRPWQRERQWMKLIVINWLSQSLNLFQTPTHHHHTNFSGISRQQWKQILPPHRLSFLHNFLRSTRNYIIIFLMYSLSSVPIMIQSL